MSSHKEVEVKPYGTKNEVETRVYGTSSSRAGEVDKMPPYGTKNESSAPAGATFNIGGTRADVEVKPYGTQDVPRDTGLNKPQIVTKTTVKPIEQWRNPLMATLLGITLALTLLSLSYLPRAVSGLWHWTTSWTPWGHHHSKAHEAYNAVQRESLYQQGKDKVYEGIDRASDLAYHAKDRMEGNSDSFYDRVKHTGEDIVERARDVVYPSNSLTEEAKRGACYTAQRARDAACDGVNMRGFNPDSAMRHARQNVRETARDARDNVYETAEEAADRAGGVFETAKQKAAEMLDAAKQTVTYPINAARDTAESVGETLQHDVQRAKDTVMRTGEDARYKADRAARDTVRTSESAAQAAKDTVLNAGQAAKDTVLNAGQAVKDTVVNAANMASNAVHGTRDTVTRQHVNHRDEDVQARGPTRVKVEVQEL